MPRINAYTLRDNTALDDADNFAVDTPAGVYRTRFQDVRDRVVSDTTVGQFSPDWLSTAISATLGATQIGASITTGGVTVTIPDGLPIGTEREIHKANAGAQDTIAFSGAESGPATLTLTSEGDYWRLRKVTSTIWVLVGGFETIINSNGQAVKEFTGVITQTYLVLGNSSITVAWTFPVAFSSSTSYEVFAIGEGTGAAYFVPNLVSRTATGTDGRWNATPPGGVNVNWQATGRWY